MSAEPKVVKLIDPVEIETKEGKTLLAEIRIPKFQAKYLKWVPQTMLDGKPTRPGKVFPLVSAMTGVSQAVIGELCIEDFNSVVTAVTEKMGESSASGQTGKS